MQAEQQIAELFSLNEASLKCVHHYQFSDALYGTENIYLH
jgi:hypothetical protein